MSLFQLTHRLPEGYIYHTDLNNVVDFQLWLNDFEALLDGGTRFVTVCLPICTVISEAQHLADRKLYIAWIKANKTRLQQQCAAMIRIETDPTELADIHAQSAQMSKAVGIPYIATDNAEDALKQAFMALQHHKAT